MEYEDYEEASYWRTVSESAALIEEYGLYRFLKDVMPLLDRGWLPVSSLQCRALYADLSEVQLSIVNRLFTLSEPNDEYTG